MRTTRVPVPSTTLPTDPAATDTTATDGRPIGVGSAVEVHSRFDQRWTTGFTVVEAAEQGYRLRRTSDGSILPAWFPGAQVRLLDRR